jgi:hypothetical protein
MSYKVVLPSDFDDHVWEIEAKGWFAAASVEFDGLVIDLSFYDPTRLMQDIELTLSTNRIFFEKNIVVVTIVNRDSIEASVKFLHESGELGRYKEGS